MDSSLLLRAHPLLRALHLREQNLRLRRHSEALQRRAEDAVFAARLTRVFCRAEQQTPEQWTAHTSRWATLVGDETEQLRVTEEQAILAEIAALRLDE
jgi:hypothetical protein